MIDKPLADRLFDATHAFRVAEDALITEAERIVGDHDWWGDLSWDDYDRSFEFHGVTVGQDLTDEQLTAFGDIGFVQCWLNYTDGTERHYRCSPPARGVIHQGHSRACRFAPIERALAKAESVDGTAATLARRALAAIKLASDRFP